MYVDGAVGVGLLLPAFPSFANQVVLSSNFSLHSPSQNPIFQTVVQVYMMEEGAKPVK